MAGLADPARTEMCECMSMPRDLEQAIYGLYATHAVHLADKHGIFGHVIHSGPQTSYEIALNLGINEDAVERLLIVLGSVGVLTVDKDDCYQVPANMTPFLDEFSPRYIGGFVHHLVNSTQTRMPRLDEYIVLGKERADEELPDPFDVLYSDGESVGAFMAAMWQLSFDVSHELSALAELHDVRHLIDVGGAAGPFTVAALREYPRLSATVFDLPVVEPHFQCTRSEFGLEGRMFFSAGDFFHEELPRGDCVAFGYVLSEWTDDQCLELLRKAYRACAPGGYLLVMDRLFDDDMRGPLDTAVMNLSMHVETRGRHRTTTEYNQLIHEVGFIGCELRRSTADKHLLLARKP